jgi:alpha-glucuronidase
VLLTALCLALPDVRAEDGYELWLRYKPVEAALADEYRSRAVELVAPAQTPTQRLARDELRRGLQGLLGRAPHSSERNTREGAIVVGTPASSRTVAAFKPDVAGLGREGYLIRSVSIEGHAATLIAANEDIGALYGVFHLLRLMQTRQSLRELDIREAPEVKLRVLDHWDNLDRSVERGYAGASIWDWHKLSGWPDERNTEYSRSMPTYGRKGSMVILEY